MRIPYFWLLTVLFLCTNTVHAQSSSPKRELRGVWISTIQRIDWPTPDSDTPQKQKKSFIAILDAHKKMGINAIFVQIRPNADALYRSKKEPWSEWLTGVQGKSAGYDPLQFMVKACHERGMEIHAWFNPFRAVFDTAHTKLSPKHVAIKHPEWMVQYGKGKVINPGLPEARNHIIDVILDVVRRYDIDGVHFDDYFYPYPVGGKPFNDQAAYKRYGGGYASLGDWRRTNINLLIQALGANIRDLKPWIKFGVSPFGVWRNNTHDPLGSATQAGIPSYDSIYADTRLWMERGWIDYVLPQLYWSMDFKPASYRVLLPWWAENSFGRHLYIGHAVYKIRNNADKSWDDPEELPRQLRMVREYAGKVHGSVFFRSAFLEQDLVGIKDRLCQEFYTQLSLPPTMPWKDPTPPVPPRDIEVMAQSYGTKVLWKRPQKASDGQRPFYYGIYRQADGETAYSLIAILPAHTRSFLDQGQNGGQYKVSSLDRNWNEAMSE